MKIVQQVCTLDQAKKLKELGVMQISYFYWWRSYLARLGEWAHTLGERDDDDKVNSRWAAYSVAELGEMLPTGYDTMRLHSEDSDDCEWYCYDDTASRWPHAFQTEAECRAAMLIHLIENNLIKVEDINNRLKQSV